MKDQKRGKRRRFKLRHLLVAVLAILIVWFGWFRIGAHRQLNGRLRELRAQGYPMNLDELDRSYRLPDGAQNAAPFYLDAFETFVAWDQEAREGLPHFGKAPLPARTEPLDASTRQQVEAYLADNQRALSLLHEAADIEHCRYPVDFDGGGVDGATPWITNLRDCARLLSIETLAQCERGDVSAAMESVRANLALARSLEVPLLMHRLIHIAVRAMAYRSIERIVSRTPLTDEQLQTLSGWIKASQSDEGYERALVGERCFMLRAFESPADYLGGPTGPTSKLVHLLMAPRRVLGFHDKDMLSAIDLVQERLDTLDLPYPERLATQQSIEESGGAGRRPGLLTRILMPALWRTFQLEARCIAHLRATQTALVIERYRLAEGRLPTALDDLAPAYLEAVPQDPFDGKDLRYGTVEAGYVVYSIGDDLIDDGGTERGQRKRDEKGRYLSDVTFSVQR